VHEVGIMESAISLVERHAAACAGRRVTRVVLRIGALAGVENDALRFAFGVVSKGTVAEGADFDIEEVPVEVHCVGCGEDFEGGDERFVFTCPACGDLCGEIRRGRELELSRIELN
jgi:hydrogenase nickel incorporation protein HypA/HybF